MSLMSSWNQDVVDVAFSDLKMLQFRRACHIGT
jgi:hypothetical protein